MKQAKIIVNCDGGSRGNPGKAAIGVVVWDAKRNKIAEYKDCIGIATNNVAEYKSLIKSLEVALKYTANELLIYMDSEFVIKQVKGEYKVKKPHLIPLYKKVKELEENFFSVEYAHVSRENPHQVHADALVNLALDEKC